MVNDTHIASCPAVTDTGDEPSERNDKIRNAAATLVRANSYTFNAYQRGSRPAKQQSRHVGISRCVLDDKTTVEIWCPRDLELA
jgi:hypothetical protein